jgi:hypothetical protein
MKIGQLCLFRTGSHAGHPYGSAALILDWRSFATVSR